MSKFYITFGSSHEHVTQNGNRFDHDSVGVIEAENYQKAREIAFSEFGDKFCTIYYSEPDMSLYPRGVIAVNGASMSELELSALLQELHWYALQYAIELAPTKDEMDRAMRAANVAFDQSVRLGSKVEKTKVTKWRWAIYCGNHYDVSPRLLTEEEAREWYPEQVSQRIIGRIEETREEVEIVPEDPQ